MYVIGLTGNIATGKSTVAMMLSKLGACVIDADKLAHWVMRPGTETHRAIVKRFGAQVLRADGEIDRPVLARVVFSDSQALRDLEEIVHPVVIEETLRRLKACNQPVAVIEAVKLLEAGMRIYCDAIWLVTCTREQQLERLLRARHLSLEQAEMRLAAQPSIDTKLTEAAVVIDNSRTLQETWVQVLRAWNEIPGLSRVPEDMLWIEPERKTSLRAVKSVLALGTRRVRWVAWGVLAVGMALLTLGAAQDRGLSARQLAWLVALCVGIAGVTAWVLSWE